MKLDTIEKTRQFVSDLGVMEFVFVSDNIATYRTPIPKMVLGMLTDYEVLFFIEECDTFYRMDSFNDFLSSLDIFEIKEVCEELSQTETIYHRKYKTNEIINSEEGIINSMKEKYVSFDELVSLDINETEIKVLERMLKNLLVNEDYEQASAVRDKIHVLENTKTGI